MYKTTSVIRQLGSSRNPLESCTLSLAAFRNFLREVLFVQGKRVEIWQQKGRNEWVVGKQASPGNLQDVEEEFAGHIESAPVIVAIKIQAKGDERLVGVCFADASVRELGISEFPDNEVYSNLEVCASLALVRWHRRAAAVADNRSRSSFNWVSRRASYSQIRTRRISNSKKFVTWWIAAGWS